MSTTHEPDIVAYPPERLARYRAAGVPGERTIAQEFRAVADAYPDRPALLTTIEELTYAELDRRTDRVALGLRALGLQAGERVLMQFTNTGWAVVVWYGLIKAGLVPVATLAQHRRHEIFDIAAQCEPAAHLIETTFRGQDLVALARDTAAHAPSLRVLLTIGPSVDGAVTTEALLQAGPADDAEARDAVEALGREITGESLACLQLSGGTTSTPKLIPRLHAEYWLNARLYAEGMELDESGCVPHLLPVIHNAGIVCGLHAAHAVGACFAVCSPNGEELKTLAATGRLTHLMMPPPVEQMVHADPELRELLRTLKVVIYVLGAPSEAIIEEFEPDGCVVGRMFGQSEGMCMITPLRADATLRHDTVGAPLHELDEVRILRPDSEEPVAPGEPGELCCRGPYTIPGYYRSPERNREAFTREGFYRTGDIVREIPRPTHPTRPCYRLEDRLKDLINRGGEKVNAVEIEELLVTHPAIDRAALVAMPDARLGERACAFVVAADGTPAPDLPEIQAYLDGRGVAKYKWPERVEIRDALPLTNVQKVDKKTLRAEIAALLAAVS
ncbi:MAG TPA: AMP-binding protein [Solirubrobacteraceae bacterium]|nr:AMP-binding protein [Solirubrobacteraceae bacterium]